MGAQDRALKLYPALDACCIDRFSGQSWPILDFPLSEFPVDLCRFLLPSPLGACRSTL